jgi:hypothetical protein
MYMIPNGYCSIIVYFILNAIACLAELMIRRAMIFTIVNFSNGIGMEVTVCVWVP